MLFFRPRTPPKTFLQCFALEQREYIAKHCIDVLGRVLRRKNKIQNRSFTFKESVICQIKVNYTSHNYTPSSRTSDYLRNFLNFVCSFVNFS